MQSINNTDKGIIKHILIVIWEKYLKIAIFAIIIANIDQCINQNSPVVLRTNTLCLQLRAGRPQRRKLGVGGGPPPLYLAKEPKNLKISCSYYELKD